MSGEPVNLNHYAAKEDVYLNGGPGINAPDDAAGLPAGTYYFQVTDPSGKTLLSTDAIACRQFTVDASGVVTGVTGPCPHATGADGEDGGAATRQWSTSVSRGARGDTLELERDLFPAEVDDLVTDDLGDECAVLPYVGADDQYVIVGTELSLHVVVDDDGERLAVLNAAVMPDSALERERARGWPGPVRFSVREVDDDAAAQDAISHLRREVAAHDAA